MEKNQAPQRLTELIQRAAETAGSEYKVAKMLGIPQTIITDWKAGRRTCVPADRARLAGIAQLDAVQELVLATLEQTEGTKRGDDLRHLLGKTLIASGAVIASAGAHASTIFSIANESLWGAVSYFIQCIEMINHKRKKPLYQL